MPKQRASHALEALLSGRQRSRGAVGHEAKGCFRGMTPVLYNTTSLSGDRQYYYVVCLRLHRFQLRRIDSALGWLAHNRRRMWPLGGTIAYKA